MKPFLIALSTLTLFPASPGKWSDKDLKNSVAFYPVVGILIGGLLALAVKIPIPLDLQALVLLILWVKVTMAFHLDGWGDCLDGWFGGHTPGQRRRIMKDAAMGVYGVTGIVIVLLSKYVLLLHLAAKPDAGAWLLAIPALARYAVVVSCFTNRAQHKEKGLGSKVLGISPLPFTLSTLFTFSLFVFLKWNLIWALAISLLVSFAIAFLSKNKIGSLTGDGMGATIELSEVCLLFLACLRSI